MSEFGYPQQVVILGGGLTPDGRPTQETAERTASGVYYALENDVESVIFSGGRGYLGSGEPGPAEAEVMAELAVSRGLDEQRIAGLDTDSRSTFESFLNIKPFLHEAPLAVVTHAYHQPRVQFMARLTLSVPVVGIEALAVHTGKAKAPLNERVLRLVTRATMLGVQQGDEQALKGRNDLVVRLASQPGSIPLLRALFRRHTSVQGLRDEDES